MKTQKLVRQKLELKCNFFHDYWFLNIYTTILTLLYIKLTFSATTKNIHK